MDAISQPETSFDVRIWAVKTYRRKRGDTYGVRWVVSGEEKHQTFATWGLADSFRSNLVSASRRGEAFSIHSGLPSSLWPAPKSNTWYEFACEFVDATWCRLSPGARRSLADVLASTTIAVLSEDRDRPDFKMLRAVLYGWAFNSKVRHAEELDLARSLALTWVLQNSPSLSHFGEPSFIRRTLDRLTVTHTGAPAAANTVVRRRAVLHKALASAVESGKLDNNPIERLKWTPPEVADAVDRRVVVNHDQARMLLKAVESQGPARRHLVAFFACMYYAAMRPGEVTELRQDDLTLPESGWGEMRLQVSNPSNGGTWTDTGNREARPLKHRARREGRIVPCAPDLVALLRSHIDEFGTAPDGRLFRGARGGPVPEATYGRVWREARIRAFTEAEVISPLAGRPYDLRHACVSTWLNAGVDPTQVAEWAGHSVQVLLKVYAKCIVGREEVARQKIEQMLGTFPTAPPPG